MPVESARDSREMYVRDVKRRRRPPAVFHFLIRPVAGRPPIYGPGTGAARKRSASVFPLSEIDQYLWMVGGSAGALALTGVAAASAFYLSTRPKPEKPLVTLHEQSLLETQRYRCVTSRTHRPIVPLYRLFRALARTLSSGRTRQRVMLFSCVQPAFIDL
ncbi:hypothetical protein EVAR_34307_1 [Eumeta japonica]|uniref:Uncharacterized protein n=1 Tax=Eumeta variegata TaxID=151549 RepID=A0A4C1VF44_EUMVA|nr:hypothetical protein EVAR_34307_1 [Eumeta japonica]